MFQYTGATIRQTSSLANAVLLTCGLTLVMACSGDKKSELQVLGADSALGRDLAMAARDSAQPQLQDVPAAPTTTANPAAPVKSPSTTKQPTASAPATANAPTAPVKAPASAPPATVPTVRPTPAPAALPVTGTVAAGALMRFTASNKVCSNTVKTGDRFTSDLAAPVQATNGFEIPAGATGTFEVVEAKTAANANDNTELTVRLVSVAFSGRSYPVDATVQSLATERVRSASKSTDAKKVAGGAIIGGIIGQVIGKNSKGTVIGAAAGAAAGTAAAAKTADYDTCLQSGATVVVRLDAPATIRPAPTP